MYVEGHEGAELHTGDRGQIFTVPLRVQQTAGSVVLVWGLFLQDPELGDAVHRG